MEYKTKFIISGLLLFLITCSDKSEQKELTDKNVAVENKTESTTQKSNQAMKTIAISKINFFVLKDAVFAVDEKKKNYVTIERIIKNNTTYYILDKILAKPGEIFLLIFNNHSLNSEHHNWVLIDQEYKETELSQVLNDFNQGTSDELSNSNIGDDIISQTGLVMPGNTAQINFTAPDQKGRYSFFCSVPGHYKRGGKGYLVVE